MLGDIGVDRVNEIEGPLFPPAAMLPDFDPAVLQAHWEALVPRFYEPLSGCMIGTVQSYVIRAGGKIILIDTCCGNGKNRPHDPGFHDLSVPYIERLAQVGVRPEEVDFVFCTHLHVDHVGWNTRLDNGRWVPTFPHATYLFSQSELEFVQAKAKAGGPQDLFSLIYQDSVLPVIEARRSRLLTEEGPWLPGLEFAFTPGHTPGHVILRANSRGDGAVRGRCRATSVAGLPTRLEQRALCRPRAIPRYAAPRPGRLCGSWSSHVSRSLCRPIRGESAARSG